MMWVVLLGIAVYIGLVTLFWGFIAACADPCDDCLHRPHCTPEMRKRCKGVSV